MSYERPKRYICLCAHFGSVCMVCIDRGCQHCDTCKELTKKYDEVFSDYFGDIETKGGESEDR